MSIFLVVLAFLLIAAGAGYIIYVERDIIKSLTKKTFSKADYIKLGSGLLAIALGAGILVNGIFMTYPNWGEMTEYLQGPFKGEPIVYEINYAVAWLGMFFFALSFSALWVTFTFHFKKRETFDEKTKKWLKVAMYSLIPASIAFFLIGTNGFGPYLTYPLTSGFTISGEGFFWTNAAKKVSGGLSVAFYGVIIVFSVFVCYWICDNEFFKKYGKHGILDMLVLVAFPSGIVGARIWYVVGNWEREFASRDWTSVFAIWDGGITILGGAAAGIIAGYLFMRFRRKYVDRAWAIDICIPTILLAQAIGRWGNFFNVEVYGQVVSVDYFRFLPNWLLMQMGYSSGGVILDPGLIHVPLFLIEGLVNVLGYFVLAFGLKFLVKKNVLVPGDIGVSYFVWYGIVRMIMEPMRDSKFNMGMDNAWSVINSIAYIAIGAALIAAFHFNHHFKKNEDYRPVALGAFLLGFVSLFLVFLDGVTVTDKEVGVLSTYQGTSIIFGSSPVYLTAYIFLIIGVLGYLAAFAISYNEKAKPYAMYVTYGSALVHAAAAIMLILGASSSGVPVPEGGTINPSYGFALPAFLVAIGAASTLGPLAVLLSKRPKDNKEQVAE